MRFSMILEMVDRLSAPAKRARAGVTGLRGSVRQMAQQVRGAVTDVNNGTRSIDHFGRRAGRLRQVALGRTFQAIGTTVRSLSRNLDGLVRRLRLVERGGKAAGAGLRKIGGMAAGLLKSGLFAGGAAVAGAGGFALFDLFRTAGQFEQYKVQLEGIEGSAQAAKKAMSWVTTFAKETPFEIDEVMNAFARLKGAGLDPTDGTLQALGDGASGNSKTLSEAIEMMLDAMQGNYERIKEFNISARKEGDKTVFSYIKNGKEITKIARGSGLPIKQALSDIFNDRFGGGMIAQSKTIFGIISNIKGMWTEFLLMVANAGIFDFVKGKLQGLLDKVNEMAASGELEAWAQAISDKMIKAWEWGEKFINSDWDATIQQFKNIAEAVGFVADGILAVKRAKDFLDGVETTIDDTLYSGFKPKPPPAAPSVPIGAETMRSKGIRLPTFQQQSSLNLGGALKIDVSGAPGLAVRATPVAKPGSNLPMEVRTGKTMRSAA